MNRKLFSVTLIALVVLLVGVAGSIAQAPPPKAGEGTLAAVDTTFTFQGHLDKGGAVTDACDFQFELYNKPNAGAQAGATLTKNGVGVNDGKFSVQLDFGGGIFEGDARYLQIAVKCSGDAAFVNLSGRVALTATPYALSLMPGAVVEGGLGNTSVVYGRNRSSSGTGPGLKGETYSSSGSAHGVLGRVRPTSPGGYSAGVRGINEGTGGNGIGVYGSQAGSGWGVYGSAPTGIGVYGVHEATTGTAAGVRGVTHSTSQSATGVLGQVNPTLPGSYSAGVRGINRGTGGLGIGVYGEQKGSGWGVYGKSASGYAGVFAGDISVSGNCVGCVLAYVGQNDGGEPLETGDLVAVSAVSSPLLGTTTPVLLVRRADAGNASAVVGVVGSKAHNVGRQSDGSREIDNVVRAEGPVAPGDYVFIVVQGLAQVKVDARGGAVRAGDTLTVAGSLAGHTGLALEGSGALHVGRAMESLDRASGLMWVMVDLQ